MRRGAICLAETIIQLSVALRASVLTARMSAEPGELG